MAHASRRAAVRAVVCMSSLVPANKVDAVEALDIDPVDVAPDYWRHVHNRLTVAQEPRVYTRTQHHAWQLRQRAEP